MTERLKVHAWKANVGLKTHREFESPLNRQISMSHGPRSYLKIRKGLQGKELGHGFWLNGWVAPATKFEKRRASRRARHTKDISDGKEYRKLWGYWEWC